MSIIPAPDPIRRRLALPRGEAETVSLRAVLPMAVDRGRFEAAARGAIARFDAFRLHVERPSLAAATPVVSLGDAADVRFTWCDGDAAVTAGGQAVHFVISQGVSDSTVALHAPAWCADRRSLEIVMDRIVATLDGRDDHGRGDEVSYLDVAAWLDELLRSGDGWRGRLHWRRVLPDGTLAFAGDALVGNAPSPAESTREVRIVLPEPRSLRELSRESREAHAALAWMQVLRDMTETGNQSPLVLGCLCDGRTDEGLRDAVGAFSRFVPLIMPTQQVTADEAVSLVATAIAEGRDWQEMFRWEEVAALDFFPYVFAYREATQFDGWRVADDEGEADPDRYLIFLRYEELSEGARVVIRSRHPQMTQHALATLASRWIDQVERCLDVPVFRPRLRRAAVRDERHEREQTHEHAHEHETLHGALAWACAAYGDRIAVSSLDGTLSFAALDALASGMAALLPEVTPGSVMALHAEPSPDLIVAMHAVLKLDAACLPIPPGTADAEARALLTRAGVTFALSDRVWPAAELTGCEVLDLRAVRRAIEPAAASVVRARPVTSDQVACVLPTQSASGARVAVGRSHRSLLDAWRACVVFSPTRHCTFAGGGDDENRSARRDHTLIPERGQPRRVGISRSRTCDAGLSVLFPLLSGQTLVFDADDSFEDVDLRIAVPTLPGDASMRLWLATARASAPRASAIRPAADTPLDIVSSGPIRPSAYVGFPAETAEDFVPHPSGDGRLSFRGFVAVGPIAAAVAVTPEPRAATTSSADATPPGLAGLAGVATDVPRTPLEAQLLREWEEILDSQAVSVETSFLDAGGDSFSIAQFNLRIRRILGLEIPLVDMFRYSNIRLLAQHLAAQPRSAS